MASFEESSFSEGGTALMKVCGSFDGIGDDLPAVSICWLSLPEAPISKVEVDPTSSWLILSEAPGLFPPGFLPSLGCPPISFWFVRIRLILFSMRSLP